MVPTILATTYIAIATPVYSTEKLQTDFEQQSMGKSLTGPTTEEEIKKTNSKETPISELVLHTMSVEYAKQTTIKHEQMMEIISTNQEVEKTTLAPTTFLVTQMMEIISTNEEVEKTTFAPTTFLVTHQELEDRLTNKHTIKSGFIQIAAITEEDVNNDLVHFTSHDNSTLCEECHDTVSHDQRTLNIHTTDSPASSSSTSTTMRKETIRYEQTNTETVQSTNHTGTSENGTQSTVVAIQEIATTIGNAIDVNLKPIPISETSHYEISIENNPQTTVEIHQEIDTLSVEKSDHLITVEVPTSEQFHSTIKTEGMNLLFETSTTHELPKSIFTEHSTSSENIGRTVLLQNQTPASNETEVKIVQTNEQHTLAQSVHITTSKNIQVDTIVDVPSEGSLVNSRPETTSNQHQIAEEMIIHLVTETPQQRLTKYNSPPESPSTELHHPPSSQLIMPVTDHIPFLSTTINNENHFITMISTEKSTSSEVPTITYNFNHNNINTEIKLNHESKLEDMVPTVLATTNMAITTPVFSPEKLQTDFEQQSMGKNLIGPRTEEEINKTNSKETPISELVSHTIPVEYAKQTTIKHEQMMEIISTNQEVERTTFAQTTFLVTHQELEDRLTNKHTINSDFIQIATITEEDLNNDLAHFTSLDNSTLCEECLDTVSHDQRTLNIHTTDTPASSSSTSTTMRKETIRYEQTNTEAVQSTNHTGTSKNGTQSTVVAIQEIAATIGNAIDVNIKPMLISETSHHEISIETNPQTTVEIHQEIDTLSVEKSDHLMTVEVPTSEQFHSTIKTEGMNLLFETSTTHELPKSIFTEHSTSSENIGRTELLQNQTPASNETEVKIVQTNEQHTLAQSVHITTSKNIQVDTIVDVPSEGSLVNSRPETTSNQHHNDEEMIIHLVTETPQQHSTKYNSIPESPSTEHHPSSQLIMPVTDHIPFLSTTINNENHFVTMISTEESTSSEVPTITYNFNHNNINTEKKLNHESKLEDMVHTILATTNMAITTPVYSSEKIQTDFEQQSMGRNLTGPTTEVEVKNTNPKETPISELVSHTIPVEYAKQTTIKNEQMMDIISTNQEVEKTTFAPTIFLVTDQELENRLTNKHTINSGFIQIATITEEDLNNDLVHFTSHDNSTLCEECLDTVSHDQRTLNIHTTDTPASSSSTSTTMRKETIRYEQTNTETVQSTNHTGTSENGTQSTVVAIQEIAATIGNAIDVNIKPISETSHPEISIENNPQTTVEILQEIHTLSVEKSEHLMTVEVPTSEQFHSTITTEGMNLLFESSTTHELPKSTSIEHLTSSENIGRTEIDQNQTPASNEIEVKIVETNEHYTSAQSVHITTSKNIQVNTIVDVPSEESLVNLRPETTSNQHHNDEEMIIHLVTETPQQHLTKYNSIPESPSTEHHPSSQLIMPVTDHIPFLSTTIDNENHFITIINTEQSSEVPSITYNFNPNNINTEKNTILPETNIETSITDTHLHLANEPTSTMLNEQISSKINNHEDNSHPITQNDYIHPQLMSTVINEESTSIMQVETNESHSQMLTFEELSSTLHLDHIRTENPKHSIYESSEISFNKLETTIPNIIFNDVAKEHTIYEPSVTNIVSQGTTMIQKEGLTFETIPSLSVPYTTPYLNSSMENFTINAVTQTLFHTEHLVTIETGQSSHMMESSEVSLSENNITTEVSTAFDAQISSVGRLKTSESAKSLLTDYVSSLDITSEKVTFEENVTYTSAEKVEQDVATITLAETSTIVHQELESEKYSHLETIVSPNISVNIVNTFTTHKTFDESISTLNFEETNVSSVSLKDLSTETKYEDLYTTSKQTEIPHFEQLKTTTKIAEKQKVEGIHTTENLESSEITTNRLESKVETIGIKPEQEDVEQVYTTPRNVDIEITTLEVCTTDAECFAVEESIAEESLSIERVTTIGTTKATTRRHKTKTTALIPESKEKNTDVSSIDLLTTIIDTTEEMTSKHESKTLILEKGELLEDHTITSPVENFITIADNAEGAVNNHLSKTITNLPEGEETVASTLEDMALISDTSEEAIGNHNTESTTNISEEEKPEEIHTIAIPAEDRTTITDTTTLSEEDKETEDIITIASSLEEMTIMIHITEPTTTFSPKQNEDEIDNTKANDSDLHEGSINDHRSTSTISQEERTEKDHSFPSASPLEDMRTDIIEGSIKSKTSTMKTEEIELEEIHFVGSTVEEMTISRVPTKAATSKHKTQTTTKLSEEEESEDHFNIQSIAEGITMEPDETTTKHENTTDIFTTVQAEVQEVNAIPSPVENIITTVKVAETTTSKHENKSIELKAEQEGAEETYYTTSSFIVNSEISTVICSTDAECFDIDQLQIEATSEEKLKNKDFHTQTNTPLDIHNQSLLLISSTDVGSDFQHSKLDFVVSTDYFGNTAGQSVSDLSTTEPNATVPKSVSLLHNTTFMTLNHTSYTKHTISHKSGVTEMYSTLSGVNVTTEIIPSTTEVNTTIFELTMPSVFIELPTYFPNSTAPIENFENYYTTEEKTNNLFDDEQNDTTINANLFRSMKFHDFDMITEYSKNISTTDVQCSNGTCLRITTPSELDEDETDSTSIGSSLMTTVTSEKSTFGTTELKFPEIEATPTEGEYTTPYAEKITTLVTEKDIHLRHTTIADYLDKFSTSSLNELYSPISTNFSDITSLETITMSAYIEVSTTATLSEHNGIIETSTNSFSNITQPLNNANDNLEVASISNPSTDNFEISSITSLSNFSTVVHTDGSELTNTKTVTTLITESISTDFEQTMTYIETTLPVEDETECSKEDVRVGKEMELQLQLATPIGIESDGTCSGNNYNATKNCSCSIDIFLKNLKHKSTEKEFKETIDKYLCNSFIPLHKGVVLGKGQSVPQKRSKREDNEVHKRDVIQNAEISRALENDFLIKSTDKLIYATPGGDVRILCAPPPLESTTGTWRFNGKSLTEGKIIEGNGYITVDTIVAQDGGNYTCTDVHGLAHVHKLSVITLPFFIVNASTLYEVSDNCEEKYADLIQKYLSSELSDIMCGSEHKMCNLVVHNTHCVHKGTKDYLETSFELGMEPLEMIMPNLNKTDCDITCQLKLYSQMAGILVKNMDIFQTQPVYFNISSLQQMVLRPTEPESNADNEGTSASKLVISCAPGFGLIPGSHICEACGPNKFSGGDEAFCSDCPLSTYQPSSGSKSCLVCNSILDDILCVKGIIMDGNRFVILTVLFVALLVFLFIGLGCAITKKGGSKDPTDCSQYRRRRKRKKNDVDVEKQEEQGWSKNSRRRSTKETISPPQAEFMH